jgi:hypothetical protein
MSLPLAVLNVEELHWRVTSVSRINGVGSIIVTPVTNTAERFHPPQRILTQPLRISDCRFLIGNEIYAQLAAHLGSYECAVC